MNIEKEIIKKYFNFVDYRDETYNKAIDFMELGYFKSIFFEYLCSILSGNLKGDLELKKNLKELRETNIERLFNPTQKDDLKVSTGVCYSYRSKYIENIIIFKNFIQESIIFTNSKLIKFFFFPYRAINSYKLRKKNEKWSKLINNLIIKSSKDIKCYY